MEFHIYQAPVGEGAFGDSFDSSHPWKHVWTGTLPHHREDVDALNKLFAKFQRIDENRMPPDGYMGRSLSMGDLVQLDGRWYFCAAVGWTPVGWIPDELM